jgi:hypothetical protein
MNMKNRKVAALPRAGIEANNELSSLLILGMALMLLRGLITLKVLKALRLAEGIAGMSSIIPRITTRKSIQFHPSLR